MEKGFPLLLLSSRWLVVNDGVGRDIGHLLSTTLAPLGLVFYFGYFGATCHTPVLATFQQVHPDGTHHRLLHMALSLCLELLCCPGMWRSHEDLLSTHQVNSVHRSDLDPYFCGAAGD